MIELVSEQDQIRHPKFQHQMDPMMKIRQRTNSIVCAVS
jgi:hypothetical protein